jgi:protein-S-isoprenylcysteine O-methyltransferase Ste14
MAVAEQSQGRSTGQEEEAEAMNTTGTIQEPLRSLIYRVAVFLYGVAAYVIGVGALLAVILVMLGVFHFTGGSLGELGLGGGLALDFLLLVAFALQHSVMARPGYKARWTRIIPAAAERSTYVLATGLVLAPLLALWQPMPLIVWSVEVSLLRWSLLGVALAGWAYLLAASFAINHFELFGLQQVYQALRGRPLARVPFRERWMYRFDRHPIMTGILIGIWVTPTMTLDHLLFAAGFTVYVWIGVLFEERSLQRQWGRLYEEYRERAGTIVPTFTGRRSKPALGAAATSTRAEESS